MKSHVPCPLEAVKDFIKAAVFSHFVLSFKNTSRCWADSGVGEPGGGTERGSG